MFVEKLRLYNFRNLKDGEITFPNAPVFITGQNGNGKSNLLESITLLSHTRSFRTSQLSEIISIAASAREMSVFAHVQASLGEYHLGLSLKKNVKEGFVDGNKVKSQEEFIGRLKSVVFSPQDLALVQGGPSVRRRFIDKHLVDRNAAALKVVVGFQRILQSKNALLKTGKATLLELESWNILLAAAVLKLNRVRKEFIVALTPVVKAIHAEFAASDGVLELTLNQSLQGESEEALFQKLMKVSERELATHSAVIGPQRDDLEILLAGRDSRTFASQGQARSIAVALTVAVVRLIEETTSESVLLLLDDLDSELDATRREYLFQTIFREPRQTFITGTELRANQTLAASTVIYHVKNGVIEV